MMCLRSNVYTFPVRESSTRDQIIRQIPDRKGRWKPESNGHGALELVPAPAEDDSKEFDYANRHRRTVTLPSPLKTVAAMAT